MFEEVILDTVILGDPLMLVAVVAVPVTFPTNPPVEVVTPETKSIDAFATPRVAIPVLFKLVFVNEVITPLLAVIIPVILIF